MLLLASVLCAAMLASPGRAITNGQPDTEHEAVGALLSEFPDFPELGAVPTCTGTLLSPTIFVTSAHCTEDPGGATVECPVEPASSDEPCLLGVTFDPAPLSVAPAYVRIARRTLFPGFALGNPFADLEVIELEEPVLGITPAQLPPLGSLGEKQEATESDFTVVGYGSSGLLPAPGGKLQLTPDIRRFATTKLDGYVFPVGADKTDVSLNSLLKLSSSPGHGGGACFGDSGGPTFVDGTNVVAGVTALTTKNCTGIYEALRLDTLPVRSFLSAFVPVP
jgi:hypothetical protein